MLRWIYLRGVTDFAAMTDLAKGFREELAERATISTFTAEAEEVSTDGTRKFLFRLADGESVETVLIPMEEGRGTLCVSTQVGCAMQCTFCLTGTFGLTRNLTAAEIVNQVCAVRASLPGRQHRADGDGRAAAQSRQRGARPGDLLQRVGFDYSPRKVTLSTCGAGAGDAGTRAADPRQPGGVAQCHHRCRCATS